MVHLFVSIKDYICSVQLQLVHHIKNCASYNFHNNILYYFRIDSFCLNCYNEVLIEMAVITY